MATAIVLDITRLVGRARLAAPTGIDRVEFAYATALKARYGDRLKFGVRAAGDIAIMGERRIGDFLAETARMWTSEGSDGGQEDVRRLAGFLGAAPAALSGEAVGAAPPQRRARAAGLAIAAFGRRFSGLLSDRREAPDGSVYVNVAHGGLGPAGPVEKIIGRHGFRPVFLLHDLIPITHPEYGRDGEAKRHEARMSTMLRHGRLIITNSDDTLRELAVFAAAAGLPMPETLSSHLGIESTWSPDRRHGLEAGHPYFVYVSTIEPRKNHLLLLNVWRRLVELHGAAAPRLVLVGRRGWENENVIDMLDRCQKIAGHVFESGRVADRALSKVLRGARALLFPSFTEGFGLPLAEALAMGVPAVAADLPVFREIGQDVPEFLDPLDGPGWISAILDYAAPGSPRREAQTLRLAHYQPPGWPAHFEPVFHRLDALMES